MSQQLKASKGWTGSHFIEFTMILESLTLSVEGLLQEILQWHNNNMGLYSTKSQPLSWETLPPRLEDKFEQSRYNS